MKTISTLISALLIVLFLHSPVQSAHPKTIWQTGHLLFWNKASLEGDLSYNWLAEMVSCRQPDGRICTYSANQIAGFDWFDYTQLKHRHFISLVKPIDSNRTNQVFFEVFLDGPLTVVRQLKPPRGLFKRMFSHPAYSTDQPTLAQNHDLFNYFVYDAGRLLALDRFYIDIYQPLMTTYDQPLRNYRQNHNISDRTVVGRLVLIDRYNAMVQSDLKSASAKIRAGSPD